MCVSRRDDGCLQLKAQNETHTHTHLPVLFPLHTLIHTLHTSLDNQPPHPPSCPSPSLSASPHSSGGNPKGRTHFAPHGNSSNDEDAGKDDADEGEGSVKWPTGCAGGYGGTSEGAAKLGASVAATKEVKLLEPNGVRNPQPIHVQTCPHKHTHSQTHTGTKTHTLGNPNPNPRAMTASRDCPAPTQVYVWLLMP